MNLPKLCHKCTQSLYSNARIPEQIVLLRQVSSYLSFLQPCLALYFPVLFSFLSPGTRASCGSALPSLLFEVELETFKTNSGVCVTRHNEDLILVCLYICVGALSG